MRFGVYKFPGYVESVLRFRSRPTKYNFCYIKTKKGQQYSMKKLLIIKVICIAICSHVKIKLWWLIRSSKMFYFTVI